MRTALKKWGMAFLEWLFTGVAFGLGVLLVAALFLGICATFAGAAQAETVTIPRRRLSAPGHVDPCLPHRVGTGRAGVRFRGANPYRELVEKQHGVERRGARVGAVHALHGEMAPHGCAGSGRARAVQSRLGAQGVRHL